MKHRLLLPLTALALCPLSAFASQAVPAMPAAPVAVPDAAPRMAKAHENANHVQGRVTAVDPVKRTITVDPRGAAGPVTLSLAPNATFYVAGMGTVAALKVGDLVSVYGQATPDAPALSTDRIVVMPPDAIKTGPRTPKRTVGFHPKRVDGTVTALTPAFTIATPGKITVTVTTTPTTQVETQTPGSFTDIAVGQSINAHVGGDPAAPIATEINVLRVRARQGQGRRMRAKDTPPAAQTAPAPAAP